MKVCVYLELEKYFETSGIGSAVENQRKALELNGVEVTDDPDDDYDVLHLNTIGPKSFYLARTKRKDSKVVIHAHTTAEDFKGSFVLSDQISPFLKKYLKYYYNLGDALLCPSEYTKNRLKTYDLSLEPQIISNGIDTNKFKSKKDLREKYRKKYNIKNNETVVFAVGSLFMRKGIDIFAEVGKEFPNTKFIWFGPSYSKLQGKEAQEVIKNSSNNVKFPGKIDNILGAYSLGDIFFFPSRRENQGIVTLEAASSGKPLILSNIPGFDFWTNKEDCFKGSNKEEYIEHLEKLLSSKDLRDEMSKKAEKTADEHDLERIGEKLIKIYREENQWT